MTRERVRRVPVVEEGRLVGVLAWAEAASDDGIPASGRTVERISET